MSDDPDKFVINRLRKKPISYTVGIDHIVINGEWAISVSVKDLADDLETRKRVASDLRRAAEMLEDPENEAIPT